MTPQSSFVHAAARFVSAVYASEPTAIGTRSFFARLDNVEREELVAFDGGDERVFAIATKNAAGPVVE